MTRWSCLSMVVLLGPWGCAREEEGDVAGPPPASASASDPFGEYTQRSKAAEAKLNVNAIFRLASLYLEEEPLTAAENGALGVAPPHVCPSDGRAEGETGITPPLDVACSKGMGGKCIPGGSGDGGYAATLWREGNVWPQLGFELMDPHFFHYNFKWKNDPSGSGSCQFTVQAFGDLDGDGTYSTFERSGTAVGGEVTPAGELRITDELE